MDTCNQRINLRICVCREICNERHLNLSKSSDLSLYQDIDKEIFTLASSTEMTMTQNFQTKVLNKIPERAKIFCMDELVGSFYIFQSYYILQ